MIYSNYFDYKPVIGDGVFAADGSKIIGRAELADHVSIWFNTGIRADVNFIKIGRNSNIQDLCMLHVTEQNSLTIGENTSLGHSVVLHGCKIGNGCLIGMADGHGTRSEEVADLCEKMNDALEQLNKTNT
jgi:carbonic anhydrase/acetyltransferase-like protein (isoleucine patch superfamily)